MRLSCYSSPISYHNHRLCQTIASARNDVLEHQTRLNLLMDRLFSGVMTPLQMARYYVWVEKNNWCLDMLDTLGLGNGGAGANGNGSGAGGGAAGDGNDGIAGGDFGGGGASVNSDGNSL